MIPPIAPAESLLVTTKVCADCGQEKALDDFYKQRGRWRKTRCKPCYYEYNKRFYHPAARRLVNIKNTYGLTPESEAAMLVEQGGACAICHGRPPIGERLRIDHDHATGKIRGLLCDGCNKGLGQFKDSPSSLLAAAAYLARERP